ncbi:hypothetical protein DQG23_21200 [Paenibacillus contaminans]|uniref:Uncharacterized protein n=1 Tax=Paenibacillus contaminans TaxID=450362 RepID=A0A329MJI6_9BACL|nr:hypothetical protein DQG23_21200 [Paenibacillus contaminans]
MEPIIRIHSKYMAGWLLYHGHELFEVVSDDAGGRDGFNVFIFRRTVRLRSDMERYQKPDCKAE